MSKEESKFKVGKWYKRTDYTGEDYQKNWKLYFKISNIPPGSLDCSETIDVGGIHRNDKIREINASKIEVSLKEIQEFLPDNHPDKFKTMKEELTELPEKWCVKRTKEHGDIINKWFCDNNYGIPYLIDEQYITISDNKKSYITCIPTSTIVEITFEQFKKWVLEKDVVEDKPVKANRFKKGDKVCIPRIKQGNPWYKNNQKELDDYKKNYFIIKYDYSMSTNVGLYRDDDKIFLNNSFYESDLVPYIELLNTLYNSESIEEEWIPKVGDYIYAEKSPSSDFRTIENVPVFKLEEIHKSGNMIYLRPEKGCTTGILSSLCRKAEAHEISTGRYVPSYVGSYDTVKDAKEEFENSFINLSIEDIATKGSQESYVDTYLDNIRSKELALKRLTDKLTDAKVELKDLESNKKEKLDTLQTRLDKLNEGIDISDIVEKK